LLKLLLLLAALATTKFESDGDGEIKLKGKHMRFPTDPTTGLLAARSLMLRAHMFFPRIDALWGI
jgi:hypothetical protein